MRTLATPTLGESSSRKIWTDLGDRATSIDEAWVQGAQQPQRPEFHQTAKFAMCEAMQIVTLKSHAICAIWCVWLRCLRRPLLQSTVRRTAEAQERQLEPFTMYEAGRY